MFQAVCSECGKNCEVPFKPSGDKPVYCSVCFEQRGGASAQRPAGRDFGRPGRSDFRDREKRMFTAICDKCGKQCEVPFRPTEGKPVFCDACFGKGNAGQEKRTGPSNADQLTAINTKLDSIMKALSAAGLITAPKKEEKAKTKEVKVAKEIKAVKEPAAKKAAPAKKKAAPKKKK